MRRWVAPLVITMIAGKPVRWLNHRIRASSTKVPLEIPYLQTKGKERQQARIHLNQEYPKNGAVLLRNAPSRRYSGRGCKFGRRKSWRAWPYQINLTSVILRMSQNLRMRSIRTWSELRGRAWSTTSTCKRCKQRLKTLHAHSSSSGLSTFIENSACCPKPSTWLFIWSISTWADRRSTRANCI